MLRFKKDLFMFSVMSLLFGPYSNIKQWAKQLSFHSYWYFLFYFITQMSRANHAPVFIWFFIYISLKLVIGIEDFRKGLGLR